MNNGNPIGIVEGPLESKDQDQHNHQRTKKRVPNGIRQRKEQDIHLLFSNEKSQ